MALRYRLLCSIINSLRCERPGWDSRGERLWLREKSVDDFDAHVAGGAGDHADGGFFAVGVEIGLLEFDDLDDLLLGDLADLVRVGLGGTGGDAGGLLQEHGRRRR